MTLLSKERFAASPSLAEEHGSKGAARAVEGRGPSSARRGGTCTCTCTSPYSDRAPTAPCPTRRALPFDFDGGDGCARRLRSWLGWLMLLWSSTGSHLVCVRARARAYLWRMHLCSRSERLHDARCFQRPDNDEQPRPKPLCCLPEQLKRVPPPQLRRCCTLWCLALPPPTLEWLRDSFPRRSRPGFPFPSQPPGYPSPSIPTASYSTFSAVSYDRKQCTFTRRPRKPMV